MKGFVRAKNHAYERWGTGKIIEVRDSEANVSWFDSPFSEPRIEEVSTAHLVRVILERHTRVYWLDRRADAWRVGRVIDADDMRAQVRFPNIGDVILSVSDLEVRWDRPISDPSAFLAAQINESPQFAEARSRFSRSQIAQRGACSGMSGLISSIIDLERHQYEVVKRVLQDPMQRYLLADEVGLGKTVEAGVLIRQFVLDHPQDHIVVVITPSALLVQWRRELRKRFLLGDFLDDSLLVMSIDASPKALRQAVQGSGMVVVDEAHHLSHNRELYATLREPIIEVPRVLLLSATPVLHNERGFLEMLHLLDPHVYKLAEEAEFRQRIEHRQALAESVAGLVPGNLLQIEDFIDDVTERFPNDVLLQEYAGSLRRIVVNFPEESDPAFTDALIKLRAHLTETYRLDRRILRNRRRDHPILTPRRAGIKCIRYSSSDVSHLVQAVEAWRAAAAEAVYGNEDSKLARSLATWFRSLLEAILTDPDQVIELVQKRLDQFHNASASYEWEFQLLGELVVAAKECAPDLERIDLLRSLIDSELRGSAKIVIFCSQPSIADAVAEGLQSTLSVPVDRHGAHENPEDDFIEQDWEKFLSNPAHRVLVCDAGAEEGLNLQGGEKVVIHFDLPLAPNRIEQRLGRVDRYGSGSAIRSLAICCREDPYSLAWFGYLDLGLRLFDRSVASLQYLIEDEMRTLSQGLLIEGTDALGALTERTSGEHGSAERELRRIGNQDDLDALALPNEDAQFDTLTDVDFDWGEISESAKEWIVNILQVEDEPAPNSQITRFGFGAFRFCFSYGHRRTNTLIPLTRVLSALVQVLDTHARGAHSKLLKTGWYSCRRSSAVSASAPREGIRLVRFGETLVERIQEITDLDDRGRAVAMWRHSRNYDLRTYAPADLFIRFDFIIEADVSKALQLSENSTYSDLKRTLERRGDMVLAPFYKSVWLDEEVTRVNNPELLKILRYSYRRAPNDGAHQDWNINSERWPLVEALGLASVDVWHKWIPRAYESAEMILRTETDLNRLCQESIKRARQVEVSRMAQLQSRIRYGDAVTADATRILLANEERFSNAIYAAVREPRITLGTVVAVFVSPHPLTAFGAAHG